MEGLLLSGRTHLPFPFSLLPGKVFGFSHISPYPACQVVSGRPRPRRSPAKGLFEPLVEDLGAEITETYDERQYREV